MSARVVTKPIAKRMRDMRKGGKTIKEVATRVGVHQTTVWAYTARKGRHYTDMRR